MTESKDLKITVVGSLNADRFLRVDRMPAEGETLFAKGFVYAFGGKVRLFLGK
jgi:sugar/nucleoside kinase (ribokinase family)